MPTSVAGPFHLAIPVHDIAAARSFYGDVLQCPEGRSAARWVDFDLYGHQLVVHQVDDLGGTNSNFVDGDDVPVPHFGVVLPMDRWEALAHRLRESGVRFIIEPRIRFRGEAGEQGTFFLLDPSGNALEFKAFANPARLFSRD